MQTLTQMMTEDVEPWSTGWKPNHWA